MAVFFPLAGVDGEIAVSSTVTLGLDQRPVADATIRFSRDSFSRDSGRDHAYATTTGADGSYRLRLERSTAITEQEESAGGPHMAALGAAYPNPFNPSTWIPLTVARSGPVKLVVFNSSGQMVRVLADTELAPGTRQFEWAGRDEAGHPVAAGIYIYQFQTPGFAASGKMTLVDGVAAGGRAAKPTAEDDGEPFAVTITGEAISPLRMEGVLLGEGESELNFQVQPARLAGERAGGGTFELVGVPGSAFLMGSDRYQDEQPIHDVFVSSFLLQRYEVTVAEYADCADSGRCREPARGEGCNWPRQESNARHPVNCISWYAAASYCSWAGMRLPTEAEWEKGARGTAGRTYPWGDEPPGGAGNCERATMMKAGKGLGCGYEGTAPVGTPQAGTSPYGAEDMAGNVWEWLADWYDADYYEVSPHRDPVNKEASGYRTLRGNSWFYVDPDPPDVQFDAAASEAHEAAGQFTAWTDKNEAARRAEGDTVKAGAPTLEEGRMISIPSGEFVMGNDRGSGDERPLHTVWLDAFDIDEQEVTVGQYAECVDAGVCSEPYSGSDAYKLAFEGNFANWGKPGRERQPVNAVSWHQANQFCLWADKRLPTEAEWEKAARGTDGRTYPWGEEEPTCERIVMDDGGDGCGRETTWPVGSKQQGRSPYGVADMSGNVWEWTLDWYDRDFYATGAERNPLNVEPGIEKKVLRGGSLADQNPHIHRAANRLAYDPQQRFDYTIGFRCARSAEGE
jgi:formylglycine-generating enzyme required for sulfatase activity